jgi:3-dehydroquinate dehydratase I
VICTSLMESSIPALREALDGCAFAEIRLDALRADEAQIAALFASGKKLIATMRPGRHSDEERAAALGAAIRAGAAYVDVELDAREELRRRVIGAARGKGCRVIVSHHDERGTPPRGELLRIAARCFEAGADVAKIACRADEPTAAARLVGLLGDAADVLPVGMGAFGLRARIAALALGAPFMYAARAEGLATADGQPTAARLAAVLEEVQNAAR